MAASRSTWAMTKPLLALAAIAIAQIVQDQRLALHADIAVGVGGGAADDRDVDRDRLVEQPLAAVDLHHPDEIARADRVELAATLARVDEGAEADPAEQAGAAAGDLAKQLRDAAQGQVPGLDQAVGRHLAELGHQGPMATDGAPDQPVMREAIEPSLLAVAGGGGEQQAEVARLAGGQEALLQGHEDRVGRADADEARGRHHVARPDDRDRLGRTHHLVAHWNGRLWSFLEGHDLADRSAVVQAVEAHG